MSQSVELRVGFRRLPNNPDLPLPARATDGAAGFDVRSAEESVLLEPQVPRAVCTGLVIELPPGVECQVRPRSGLALHHAITLPNSPGTVDPDYRGELKVILLNLGSEAFPISRGERIAQLVFSGFLTPEIAEVTDTSVSDRGTGGFGSTGRR